MLQGSLAWHTQGAGNEQTERHRKGEGNEFLYAFGKEARERESAGRVSNTPARPRSCQAQDDFFCQSFNRECQDCHGKVAGWRRKRMAELWDGGGGQKGFRWPEPDDFPAGDGNRAILQPG